MYYNTQHNTGTGKDYKNNILGVYLFILLKSGFRIAIMVKRLFHMGLYMYFGRLR